MSRIRGTSFVVKIHVVYCIIEYSRMRFSVIIFNLYKALKASSLHHPHTAITIISIIHLKVHHIYEKRSGHDKNFGINGESIIEVNNEVVGVGESFSKAAHPLLSNVPHLPALQVQNSELHVPTEVDVTGGTSDLQ